MNNNPTGKGGFQERKQQINRKGRPKDFDGLRELAKIIAHERVGDFQGHGITAAELILRQWAKSGNPQLQRAFIEIAFGKVPDVLHTTAEIVIRWDDGGDND